MHVCYDPEHPKGLIQRHATLSTGERLRAWTHGARRKMPTVKGLSAWGIRLGEDFAISDQGFKTSSNPMGDRFARLATSVYPTKKITKKIFLFMKLKDPREEQEITRHVTHLSTHRRQWRAYGILR